MKKVNKDEKVENKDGSKSKGIDMKKLFGFELDDFKSWDNFVKLMNRPEDPSSLAVFRLVFGLLMIIDIPHERGMSGADIEYGPQHDCFFPLFDFLQPLQPQWMLVVYSVMFLGAFGIMLGFCYRISCLCFEIPYWYLFFLDKTTWNNHSYLYGLVGFLLFFCDGNRFFSIDAWLNKKIKNSHVPLWNYCLLRAQIFLVYFLAGIKKIDFDWIGGYSMENLGHHWVFTPFKFILTEKQITLYVVHTGGLIIDLFGGYLLFFDATRLIGATAVTMFHTMNSKMFNIGMFPYVMLVTTPLFYSNDWPKRLINFYTNSKYKHWYQITNLSSHCIYSKDEFKKKMKSKMLLENPKKTTNISFYHKAFALFSIVYLVEQSVLPFSHSVTKGYNNWTNGLYGYSWDMMVHSWHTQHIKVSFLDKNTNKTHYLNPKAWTQSKRWSSHADMIHQYAKCIQQKLYDYNFTNIELHMDIWRSMNHRFNQRQIDPRVDLITAEWSPFKHTKWLMPLLTELSDWRTKMAALEEEVDEKKLDVDLTFVADFPGLVLENYISSGLNTTIEVLNGVVKVEITDKRKNYTLKVGQKMELPSGTYHSVYTVSKVPSCFLYVFTNETSTLYAKLFQNYLKNMGEIYNKTLDNLKQIEPEKPLANITFDAYTISVVNHTDLEFIRNLTNDTFTEDAVKTMFETKSFNVTNVKNYFIKAFHDHLYETSFKKKVPYFTKWYRKFLSHVDHFKRSFTMAYYGFKSIITKEDFNIILNRDYYQISSKTIPDDNNNTTL